MTKMHRIVDKTVELISHVNTFVIRALTNTKSLCRRMTIAAKISAMCVIKLIRFVMRTIGRSSSLVCVTPNTDF